MPTKCFSLVKGRRIRLTKLDACGRPVYGDGGQVVSKGFISVAATANTISSDEVNVQNASGERCVFEPSETTLTGYGLEIQFCEVDPELFAMATGQDVYTDFLGNVIGFTVNTEIEVKANFGFELWSGAPGGNACANPDAAGNFGYTLFPFVSGGIVGDFTVNNGAVTFTITGANTQDGNGWGEGPYNVILNGSTPSPLPTALDPNDALLAILVDVAPPEPACGARPLLDPTAEALTGLVGTPTGLSVSIEFAPDDLTGGIWIDFGDGTWDYVIGSADPVVHVYATAGAKTISASSNGTWVETTVTVTGP